MSVSFYTADRVNFGSHPGIAAPQCGNYDDALVAAKTKAALGCGGPRGALPLIHLINRSFSSANGTDIMAAVLTIAIVVGAVAEAQAPSSVRITRTGSRGPIK